MVLDFDRILAIPLFAMRLNRSHPSIPKNFKWFLHFIILHSKFSIINFFLVYDIIYFDLKGQNFSQACRNSILVLTYSAVSLKYTVMVIHQDLMKSTMLMMKADLNNAKSLPKYEQEIIKKYAKKENFVCKQWLFICAYSCVLFQFKVLTVSLYYYVIGEFRLVHLYDIIYTPSIEARKNDLWVYIIIYYLVFYYGAYAATMYIGFVPLGPVFMLHASGQLELAAMRTERLFEDDPDDEVVKERLKVIVMSLQRTYKFVNQVNMSLSVFYEVILKVTTIILPVTFYLLIESFKDGIFDMEFSTFIISGLITSSSPCYYGDMLMEKGEQVRHAAYCCGWERRGSRSARTTLLIVLTRALRPVAIKTLFRTVCLDALTDVFQQAYTIFNLMNAVLV